MFPKNSIKFAISDSAPDDHYTVNSPTFCGIQYNHSGKLRLRIGNDRYDLKGSWVFLTYPGTVFEYELYGNEPHFYRFICMEAKSLKPYIESSLFPVGSPPIKINYPEKFSHCMDDAIALIRSGSPERHLRAVWRVEDILLQLQEQTTGTVKSGSWMALQLKQLIEDIKWYPEKPRDFNLEAIRLSITPRHFRRLFKELSGLAPNQYHIQSRLIRASNLLINTNDSIANIGSKVGIDDEYYFSTLFKQRFHLSPRAYRKEFKTHPR